MSNGKKVVKTDAAPGALGPYSQAIKVGNLIFCSGQIPLDPKTGNVVGADVGTQTDQVLKNLHAVLDATGSGLFPRLEIPRSSCGIWTPAAPCTR